MDTNGEMMPAPTIRKQRGPDSFKHNVFARRLTILNQYGLCARPTALFVKMVSKFKSNVTVTKDGNTVNGKSLMGLMTLQGSFGSKIDVRAEGPDAREVIEELTILINAGFFMDDPCLSVPKEHSEWLDLAPAKVEPPASPRTLHITFAMGMDSELEGRALVRTVIPGLRRRCRTKLIRIRASDLHRQPPVTAKGTGQLMSVYDIDPPRPFFVLVGNDDSPTLLTRTEIPRSIRDMRTFLLADKEKEPFSNAQVGTLVHCYPWCHESGCYRLRPNLTGEDIPVLHSVFRQRAGYLKEHCLVLLRPHSLQTGETGKDNHSEYPLDIREQLNKAGWKWAEYDSLGSFISFTSKVLAEWVEVECRSALHPG